jgi:hypothetical protein
MDRRNFLKNGLKGTTAYALLGGTLVGSQAASAARGAESKPVTESEIEHLMYMREEEKLARDVYLTMYDTWGLGIFYNIAQSEEVHTEAVRAKIEKYALVDPVIDDTVGAFVNKDIALLYDTLIAQGRISELDALFVGGAIEEIDMIDIQHAIDEAEHRDIKRVYENLLAGSKNHLRAFVSEIEQRGVQYPAQYLDQQAVDEILSGLSGMRGIRTG